MKRLFTITLVVELIFAVGFIAVPGVMFGTFGVTPDAFSTALVRVFGSALLAFVVLLWYGRSSSSTDLHNAIYRSMFTYWLISSVLLLMAQLAGLFNAMGWGVVVLHIVFLIAYGGYAFKK
jgi:hypothetical protein